MRTLNRLKKVVQSKLGYFDKVYTADKLYTLNITDSGRFEGKVAVVTGGAGAIGKATCKRLYAEGATVYLAGRTNDTIQAAIAELEKMKGAAGNAKGMVMDVCNYESVREAFSIVLSNEGRIDILVNCAGGGARGNAKPLAEQDVDTIDSILNSNLRGSILCAKCVCESMQKQNYGKIVNLSSSIGMNGFGTCVEYSASKSGMLGFTRSLAKEMGKYGVNVNCVAPGSIQRGDFSMLEAEALRETNYLHTVGTLEDIANVICFMVSDESKFITGQNIVVDGGRTLALKGVRD